MKKELTLYAGYANYSVAEMQVDNVELMAVKELYHKDGAQWLLVVDNTSGKDYSYLTTPNGWYMINND